MNNITDLPTDDIDLRPILGEIARHWQRVQPGDLTAPEALRVLGILTEIAERLDAGPPRPVLRLVPNFSDPIN